MLIHLDAFRPRNGAAHRRPLLDAAPAAPAAATADFRLAVHTLLAEQPHRISPKWFYDEAGSRLFERICELPEYTPTRTELGLLEQHAATFAQRMGPRAEIVEYGAGALRKVRLLIDAAQPACIVPIDVSAEHLRHCATALQAACPALAVQPLVADFTQPLHLPAPLRGAGRRIGFFPGSTLGNLLPDEAETFLRGCAAQLRGGALLLGVDGVKDPAELHAAYNDAQGVTAAFNRNLLLRANRELGTDFDASAFWHAAFYNAPLQRVEMHLVSRRQQAVHLGDEVFTLAEGESLHTECSHKYTVAGAQALARRAGFEPTGVWTDAANRFSLHWLEAAP